jgi:hypothetical protein
MMPQQEKRGRVLGIIGLTRGKHHEGIIPGTASGVSLCEADGGAIEARPFWRHGTFLPARIRLRMRPDQDAPTGIEVAIQP